MTKFKYEYRKQWPENIEALERDGYKCVKCGSTEEILVHHIDESRKLGIDKINRSLENLMTLCRTCHAKIHGFDLRFINPNTALIIELRQNNKTYQEIGDYLGISRQRVHQIMHKIAP